MCTQCGVESHIDFSDLEDGTFGDSSKFEVDLPRTDGLGIMARAATAAAPLPLPVCQDCRGSGRFISYAGRLVGDCFRCGGTGHAKPRRQLRMDPASVAQRQKDRVYAAQKKTDKALEISAKVSQFKDNNPQVWDWLSREFRRGNEFAASLVASLGTYGNLTPNQVAAVERNVMKAAERAVAREAAAPDVQGEGFTKLLQAFNRAAGTGLKSPTMRVGKLVFTLAKATSKNPGYVYVKYENEYQGKISPQGKYYAVSAASTAVTEDVARIARDPLAAAVEHGRLTGCCAICGRQLVDPVSVERGIGPICAEKFGW